MLLSPWPMYRAFPRSCGAFFLKKFRISMRYSLLFYRKNKMNIWLYMGLIVILQKNQNSMVRKIIVEM